MEVEIKHINTLETVSNSSLNIGKLHLNKSKTSVSHPNTITTCFTKLFTEQISDNKL